MSGKTAQTQQTEAGGAASAQRAAVEARAGARGALLVGMGILASRFAGLLREAVFARYFGNSAVAAAFKAALRVPNFLQNLLGEGVLSASFIPVYSSLLGAKQEEEARKVAGAVFAMLSVLTAVLVALGVVATPVMIDLIAPGFEGETRALAVSLVRIIFPMTGLLVLSAWCLGVLNSHRRFLLSYAAPVIWNGTMVAVMVAVGAKKAPASLAVWVAFGAVAGAALQVAVQWPTTLALLGRLKLAFGFSNPNVRQVWRSFGPVVVARGVVQISAYIDLVIGSLISAVAFSTLDYAQRVYLIPISLFGMSISAAELPEMSRATGESGDVSARLQERLDAGLSRVAFFVIPSAAAFVALGDVIASTLLQWGRFTAGDSRWVWYVLLGSSVGLLATTQSRLFSSTFYALKDTRTPLYVSIVRVVLTAGLAYFAGVPLPRMLGLPQELGAVGLVAATGLAAWLEFVLLRHALGRKIGQVRINGKRIALLWGIAVASAAMALGIKLGLVHAFGASAQAVATWGGGLLPSPAMSPRLAGLAILVPYGVAYLALTYACRIPQSQAMVRGVMRKLGRRAGFGPPLNR